MYIKWPGATVIVALANKKNVLTQAKTHGDGLVKVIDSARCNHGVELADLHGLLSVVLDSDLDGFNRQTLPEDVVLWGRLLLRILFLIGNNVEAGENLKSVKPPPVLQRVDVLFELRIEFPKSISREKLARDVTICGKTKMTNVSFATF